MNGLTECCGEAHQQRIAQIYISAPLSSHSLLQTDAVQLPLLLSHKSGLKIRRRQVKSEFMWVTSYTQKGALFFKKRGEMTDVSVATDGRMCGGFK